jgi:hypothetical protein
MRWGFIFLFVCSVLFSCQNKDEVLEIDEDKIVQILADMHIIEASIASVNAYYRDSLQQVALRKCAEIHEMTVEQLEAQIMYIDQRPEYHRKLYKRVIDTLESFMQRADTLSMFRDTSLQEKKRIPLKPTQKKNNNE